MLKKAKNKKNYLIKIHMSFFGLLLNPNLIQNILNLFFTFTISLQIKHICLI